MGLTGAIIGSAVIGAVATGATAFFQSRAQKKAMKASGAPKVDKPKLEPAKEAPNGASRLNLINTSPAGVLEEANTGRKKLLG